MAAWTCSRRPDDGPIRLRLRAIAAVQRVDEALLPLPSTDGTLQLRDRWFADSLLEGDGFEPSVPGHL
jgi:hypothetical protein